MVLQVLEILFGFVVTTQKRLPTIQWVERQFTTAPCYPISHKHHCVFLKHKMHQGLHYFRCELKCFHHFLHHILFRVWTASLLFEHFKEIEENYVRLGNSWYSLCSYTPGKAYEIALVSLQSGKKLRDSK